ncbi:RNA-binding protein MEX3B [Oopsacas minuta]|uniref:RNA-binding protein MEX3B n=1 Tax=Oopsacas minuta TaxID=111878 RepID=A0AAV7JTS5_9METZ|nr:RNA-binding protein MEX3B [Oopsacas minuta]
MTATYLTPHSAFQSSLPHSRPLEDSQGKSLDIALEMSMLSITPGYPATVTPTAGGENSPLNSFFFDMYAHSHRPSDSNVNATDCVQVPSSEHVAEIVGRQGCKIKALRARTNTYIKTPVRGEKPVFVVTGRKEDVNLAKREILAAADHFTQIRAQRKQAATGNALIRVGSGTHSVTGTGPYSPTDEDSLTISVKVPYHVVGLVVGPKGATIKRIQQKTSTYIITPSRDKEPFFQVTGAKENVEQARKEIEHYIAARTGTIVSSDEVELCEQQSLSYLSDSVSFGKSHLVSDLYLKPGVPDDDLFRGTNVLNPMCNFLTSSSAPVSHKCSTIWPQSNSIPTSLFDPQQPMASTYHTLTASYPGLLTSPSSTMSPPLTKASSAPLLSGENTILPLGSFHTVTSTSEASQHPTHLSPIPPIGSKNRCPSLYSDSGDSSSLLSSSCSESFLTPDRNELDSCTACSASPSALRVALAPCGHITNCENCASKLYCVACQRVAESALRLRPEA